MTPSPQRSKTLSMNAPSGLVVPVARATAPSNMSKPDPTVATMPARIQRSSAARTPPADAIAKPMSVSMLGVSPARAMASAIGSIRARMPVRVSGETNDPLLIGSARQPEELVLVVVESTERVEREAADDLATGAPRLDEPGRPESAQ